MSTLKFDNVKSVGHLAILLLTTPINPQDKPEQHKRLTNEQILDQCRANWPQAKTTIACINWYSSRLRKDDAYRAKHGGKMPLMAKEVAKKTVEVKIEETAKK